MTDLNPYEEGLALELQEAKDCIKALQKALKDQSSVSDRLAEQLATCEKYRDAYAECDRIGTQAVRGLEAKLAKTVELALEECPFRAGTPKYDKWWHHRRTTLAEIKGESHE